MTEAPELGLLVELDQRLGELVEMLVVAPLDVEVPEGESGRAAGGVERLSQSREDASELVPPGRVEPRPVPEHLANLLVLPRGHVLEHLELWNQEADAEGRALQETKGAP